jgi:hypothetical protein
MTLDEGGSITLLVFLFFLIVALKMIERKPKKKKP